MDRRQFGKRLIGTMGIAISPAWTGTSWTFAKDMPIDNGSPLTIGYAREKAPTFAIPPYRGHSYEDTVPDTLDIAERAKLGVHVLTSITDPAADYEIYGMFRFRRNPPRMDHDFDDWIQNVEGMMEALPLLRLATGESSNDQVDRAWMESALESIGPDGLVYLPLQGRPWIRAGSVGINPVWRPDGTTTQFSAPSVTQVANACTCQRIISAMTIYYLRDRNLMWKAAVEKMIRRLSELAIVRADYCYFAPGIFEPNAKVDHNAEMPVGSGWGSSWNTRLIQGLAQYYKVSGYEPARELASKLVNYTLYHSDIFDSEGRWLLDPQVIQLTDIGYLPLRKYYHEGMKYGGHGHGHGIALISVLDYAVAVGDSDLLEFCKASYEWARSPGSDFGVSLVTGWFPEWFMENYPDGEGCPIGDMVSIGTKLSAAGVGDYWDDVDRWVRNAFAEAQLTKADWMYSLQENLPRTPLGPYESADNAVQRNIGGFANDPRPNQWTGVRGGVQCCTGTCSQAIYYVWEHILDHKDEDNELRVNLLLNRASEWADLYSYIPYEGRVDLKMKKACRVVKVRVPEWVRVGGPDLVCELNGSARSVRWDGRYVNIGAAKPGDTIVVRFPISERTVTERIGVGNYSLVIKGSTVVSIDPMGKLGPLYRDREKYRVNRTAWVRVNRFVPEDELRW